MNDARGQKISLSEMVQLVMAIYLERDLYEVEGGSQEATESHIRHLCTRNGHCFHQVIGMVYSR